jgi:hypothetical protein
MHELARGAKPCTSGARTRKARIDSYTYTNRLAWLGVVRSGATTGTNVGAYQKDL